MRSGRKSSRLRIRFLVNHSELSDVRNDPAQFPQACGIDVRPRLGCSLLPIVNLKPRVGECLFASCFFEIRINHHESEFLESDFRFPVEDFPRLRRVTQQQVHFGRAVVTWVDLDVLLIVESDATERHFQKLLN